MPHLPLPVRSGAAMLAVGDPVRDRTVYAAIVLLVALGFTMIMLAVWLLRSTRPDPEVLAPLERMGERKWRRADPVWQRRHLDEVRPGGADPLEPTSAPPDTDADFERGPQPIGFDDLVASSPSTVAVASELPAPPMGTLPVDAPLDGDATDATESGTAGDDAGAMTPVAVDGSVGDGADAADADANAEADVGAVAEVDVAGDGVDRAHIDTDAASSDDDDEDITGEQDTDDFFAVLDGADEPDRGVEPIAETESDVEPNDGARGQPDVDDESAPDREHDDEEHVSDDRSSVDPGGPEDDEPD